MTEYNNYASDQGPELDGADFREVLDEMDQTLSSCFDRLPDVLRDLVEEYRDEQLQERARKIGNVALSDSVVLVDSDDDSDSTDEMEPYQQDDTNS